MYANKEICVSLLVSSALLVALAVGLQPSTGVSKIPAIPVADGGQPPPPPKPIPWPIPPAYSGASVSVADGEQPAATAPYFPSTSS